MFQVSSLPFDLLLTTYDIALIDQDFLSQIPWQFAIIDEAQRLKNPSSVCLKLDLFGSSFYLHFFCKISSYPRNQDTEQNSKFCVCP